MGIEPLAISSLGGRTCYSIIPFRHGDQIAKSSLKPAAPVVTALMGQMIKIEGREDAICEDPQRKMRGVNVEWAFRVQFCQNQKQPVEGPNRRVGRGEGAVCQNQ